MLVIRSVVKIKEIGNKPSRAVKLGRKDFIMREILFRGKNEYRGWIYGDLRNYEKSGAKAIFSHELLHRIEVIPETVGQFTGLYDATPWEELTTDEQAMFLYPENGGKRSKEDWKGKPIFEGDIMPVWENGEEYHYKVVYNGDCFMLSMLDSEQGSYPLSVKHNISEVIGNIHDNPELLKEGETE